VPPQAPRPGVIPLRPLGVGELLDGAFTTIRRYPGATLGLSAAVMLVVQAVQLVATWYLLRDVAQQANSFATDNNSGDFAARAVTLELIILVVTLIAVGLLTGVMAAIVGQASLGRPMNLGAAWAKVRPRLGALFGTTALVWLLWILAAVVGALPGVVVLVLGVAGGSDSVGVLGVVLMIIGGFVLGFYVYIRLLLATPALVLEELSVRRALSRSGELVRNSFWRVLGVFLLSWIIGAVIGTIIAVPFAIAGGFGGVLSGQPDDTFTFTPLLLSGLGGLVSSTLVRPFSAGVIALLYIDRRMRAEALDLTLQQAAAAPTP
jgi:hypothetical protein